LSVAAETGRGSRALAAAAARRSGGGGASVAGAARPGGQRRAIFPNADDRHAREHRDLALALFERNVGERGVDVDVAGDHFEKFRLQRIEHVGSEGEMIGEQDEPQAFARRCARALPRKQRLEKLVLFEKVEHH
jgi:hypothetical protein